MGEEILRNPDDIWQLVEWAPEGLVPILLAGDNLYANADFSRGHKALHLEALRGGHVAPEPFAGAGRKSSTRTHHGERDFRRERFSLGPRSKSSETPAGIVWHRRVPKVTYPDRNESERSLQTAERQRHTYTCGKMVVYAIYHHI
jgi:hypothetical protein